MREKLYKKTLSASAFGFLMTITLVSLSFYTNASAQTNDIKAITDLLNREAEAVEKKDLAALDKIWANDDSVTVFESGYADYGWTNYRDKHLAPELKSFENLKYSFSDIKVKKDGKTAWATFKYTLSADIGKRHVDSGGLATAVLEKRKGRWRIVHWHSSAGF